MAISKINDCFELLAMITYADKLKNIIKKEFSISFEEFAVLTYISQSKEDEYYLKDICTDAYNQSHTRQIKQINLVKIGQQHYIEHVNYLDSLTQKQQQWSYSKQQIQQFYQADISSLKYIVFSISLFALAALYVSIRIIRNFKQFLSR